MEKWLDPNNWTIIHYQDEFTIHHYYYRPFVIYGLVNDVEVLMERREQKPLNNRFSFPFIKKKYSEPNYIYDCALISSTDNIYKVNLEASQDELQILYDSLVVMYEENKFAFSEYMLDKINQ